MVNFEFSKIEQDVKRRKIPVLKRSKDIYHVKVTDYTSTFEDTESNYFQLVQVRPDEEKEDEDDQD